MDLFAKEPGEIQVIGRQTREWIIDSRACPLLQIHGIITVGISEASKGFRFVRTKPKMSVLMASIQGHGKAYVDGKYKTFSPGVAYLMPPKVLHAYETSGLGTWRICWVCYDQPEGQTPLISSDKPRLVRANAKPLEEAIRGLYHETINHAAAAIQKLYVELIHAHCQRITRSRRIDDRISKLWSIAESNPAHNWTLDELAREGGMSIELLRLLSKQSTGRSPMKQLTFLRMQQAASMLASTKAKISVIAQEAGYNDAFAFSVAFKRHIGLSPRDYRSRKKSVSIH